ncbi:hypothetical protein AB0J83_43570 [Actinoplanes sp. NPDC049596]|uniref:hypothetical protein n=1 Tax=Actinoplanes sp. NPDC049596 TaxID=3154625 RepID=UPI003436C30E
MLAATRDLLSLLEPLAYAERMRRLAGWARSAEDRAAVCAELRLAGDYERHLALVAAMVVRDRDGILAAVGDPAPSVRAAGLVAALRGGLLRGGVVDLAEADRRRVYRTVRRRYLPEVAEGLIAEVRPYWGDAEAAAVLPGCGAETVRALLPELEHAVNLSTLARRHPGPVLERVGVRLAATPPEHRDALWRRVADAAEICDPGGFLDLAERYAPADWLPSRGELAAHDPRRVVGLLTAPRRRAALRRAWLRPALLSRLRVLSGAELAPLVAAVRDVPRQFEALLAAMPPARRAQLYEPADLPPTEAVMELLPAAVRIGEANRVLGLPHTREREDRIRAWSAFLAWPEASAALMPALRSGRAEERQEAYRLILDAARRHRDPMAALNLLGRLRNEQDPVRAVALTALARLARLFPPAAAAELTRLTTDAVEARDTSRGTTSALATLAADVLQHHTGSPELREWALLTIDLVSGSSSVPLLRRFDQVLRRGQEVMVFERLRGWVGTGMERGQYGPLFALTLALGKRAWELPGLQELLRRAIEPPASAWVARQAVELWLADPRHRAARVAVVIETDPSMVAVPAVWDIVASSRTDLLDRVLGRRPRGRMIEAGQRWVPGAPRHADRWLPRQQAAFVRMLEFVVDDRAAGVWPRGGDRGVAG